MNLLRRIGPLRLQALKITALGGTFWFAWAFACYQGVYLQSQGFAASQMGLLNAIAAAVNIVSVSFWGMVSDRTGSLKRVLFLVLLCGSGLFAMVPFIPTGLPYTSALFLIILPCFNLFRGSMTTLVENMQVRNCNELRLNYGFTRSFGSLCFTLGSLLIASLLNSTVDVSATFGLSFLFMIPAIVLSLFVRNPKLGKKKKQPAEEADETGTVPEEKTKVDVRPLFKNKQYVSFLVFAFIFYIAANCEASFVPYYMKSIDVNPDRYGIILAYRAFLEIPFLLLMSRMRRRFSLRQLLMAAVLFMSLECLLFSVFTHSLPTMLISTTFFGLGNGLFIGSSLNYLYQLAPDHLKATAQSFFAAAASVAGIVGNLLGGVLFDGVGAKPFYLIVALLYFISVTVFTFSIVFGKRRKKPAQG